MPHDYNKPYSITYSLPKILIFLIFLAPILALLILFGVAFLWVSITEFKLDAGTFFMAFSAICMLVMSGFLIYSIYVFGHSIWAKNPMAIISKDGIRSRSWVEWKTHPWSEILQIVRGQYGLIYASLRREELKFQPEKRMKFLSRRFQQNGVAISTSSAKQSSKDTLSAFNYFKDEYERRH